MSVENAQDQFVDDREAAQAPLGDAILPKSLDFKRLEFKKGLNFTVRIGDRWAKPGLLGKVLPMNDDDEQQIGNAVITHVMVCSLADIPKFIFTKHHDGICANPIVLMDVLRGIYGQEVSGASVAVVIGFEPVLDGS